MGINAAGFAKIMRRHALIPLIQTEIFFALQQGKIGLRQRLNYKPLFATQRTITTIHSDLRVIGRNRKPHCATMTPALMLGHDNNTSLINRLGIIAKKPAIRAPIIVPLTSKIIAPSKYTYGFILLPICPP